MMNAAKKRRQAVKEAIRQPYTWPGSYPKTFVSYDGCICRSCVTNNLRAIFRDTTDNVGGWNVRVDVLWEGPAYCANCGTELESAYGNPDSD
jgi:hypothetical protein